MTENDKPSSGSGDPKKTKDLDALRARLGLADPKKDKASEESAPATAASSGPAKAEDKFKQAPKAPGQASKAEAKKEAGDGFSLDFGDRKISPSVIVPEVDAGKVTQPKGKKIVMAVAAVVSVAMALWLGMQFGKDLGLRSLHNASVRQARTVKGYFFDNQMDPSGQQLSSRVQAIKAFAESFNKYYGENITSLRNLATVLQSGDLEALEEIGEYKAVAKQIELVKPLNSILETYLASVDEMTPKAMFGDKIFHPEIAYEVTKYMDAANQLRRATEDLFDALVLFQSFEWSPEPPQGVKGQLVIWAPRKENQEGIRGAMVEMVGKPEEKKLVKEEAICEDVKLPVQIPKCEVKEGEEPYEIVELDVAQKRIEQEVITYHEVRVRKVGEDEKSAVAQAGDLIQLDIKSVLEPIVQKNYGQYTVEMTNRAVILAEIVETLDKINDLANAASPDNLATFLDKLGAGEELATF